MSEREALRMSPQMATQRGRDLFLVALGDRVRSLRAVRGLTRKALALASDVSERHLANLELGVGNPSMLVLRQVSQALGSSMAELLGDETLSSPEWVLIRDLLEGRCDDDLYRGRVALAGLYEAPVHRDVRSRRIALVGLRGAGKSSVGELLASSLAVPFVELSRELERVAGCGVSEVHNLMGQGAYRRYERRALEETIQLYPEAVIATPGGIVSDAATFNLLLSHCYTVWLKATPEEHMQRVAAQGDLRPMAASGEAMDDLRRILAGRSAFYGRADLSFDTSGKEQLTSCAQLSQEIRRRLGW